MKKTLTPQQKRRAERDKVYREVTRPFVLWRSKGRCENCGEVGTDPHHIVGRVGYRYTSVVLIIFLCNRCHREAERNYKESRPRLLKILKKKYKYEFPQEYDYLLEE